MLPGWCDQAIDLLGGAGTGSGLGYQADVEGKEPLCFNVERKTVEVRERDEA